MRRSTKSIIISAATLGLMAAAATPAFASGPTAGVTPVQVSAGIGESIGWQTLPGNISFGTATPGIAATATESYSVQTNDSSGYAVTVVPEGARFISTTGLNDDTTLGATGANATSTVAVTAVTVNGNPFSVTNIGAGAGSPNTLTAHTSAVAATTPVAYTDTWSLLLPAAIYPDVLQQSFDYNVVAS